MQQNGILLKNPLFHDFSIKEISALLNLLEAEQITCKAERIILHEGETNTHIYNVVCGEAYGVKYDISGRETVYTKFPTGSIFGDVLAVSKNKKSPVTVITKPNTILIRFSFEKLVSTDNTGLVLPAKLLKNLTSEVANKFFDLQDRVDCLVSASLREKIITFLNNEAKTQKGEYIVINQTRERFAAYLNADRSALSRELSSMKKEGIIDFKKNRFRIMYDLKG